MAKTQKPGKAAPSRAKAPRKSGSQQVTMKAPPGTGKARGLGRGLSSLLGAAGIAATTGGATGGGAAPTPPPVQSGLTELPIEWINSGPWQPRRRFDTASLAELAESIRSKGLVQPILVRPRAGATNRYELIAGERRWRAAQMAQLHTVPAIIRNLEDEEAYELALIENVQRADLSAIEEAEGYRQLIDSFGYTQEQLSEIIGKSRSHIANLLRLLSLPAEVSDMVVDGTLSMGQVRPLIGHADCLALAREVAAKGLSARQVEAMVARGKGTAKPTKNPTPWETSQSMKAPEIRATELLLQSQLGLRVDIDWAEPSGKGRMSIRFETLEQFEAVMEKLMVD
ncbi:MAG: ParB/RepB/Spo0J family partition protein [Pseudomonadota bacterium]|nr:ParB/RepB/Spo0J family partition protein [Pseudomonadota bacterium]